MPPFSL